MLGTSGGFHMAHRSTPCLMEKVNDDDEVVYIDLASAYHYLDPSNRGEMVDIHETKTLVKSFWRLQLLEHQILGVYVGGAGSKPCTLVHGDHRPSKGPPSFSYNKVNQFYRQVRNDLHLKNSN